MKLITKILMISVVAIGLFGAVFSASANADSHLTADDQAVKDAIEASFIKCKGIVQTNAMDLFWPGNNIPIIPNECSSTFIDKDGDGIFDPNPPVSEKTINVPMKLELIPNIIARLYAFLASISIYLFGAMLVFWGFQWIIGGLQYSSSDDLFNIKKNLRNSALAMLITLIISYVLIQILKVMGVSDDVFTTNITGYITHNLFK